MTPDDDGWYPVAEAAAGGANASKASGHLDAFGLPAGYKKGSRAKEEAALMARILERFPAGAHREAVRAQLDSSTSFVVAATDEALSGLLAQLYQIRTADQAATRRDESRQQAMTQKVRVGVVLRQGALDDPTISIHRRAGRSPQNVIVLSGAATGTALAAALAALTHIRQTSGDVIPNDQTITIRSQEVPENLERLRASAAKTFDRLKGSPLRNVEEFGQARALAITLGPIKHAR